MNIQPSKVNSSMWQRSEKESSKQKYTKKRTEDVALQF